MKVCFRPIEPAKPYQHQPGYCLIGHFILATGAYIMVNKIPLMLAAAARWYAVNKTSLRAVIARDIFKGAITKCSVTA